MNRFTGEIPNGYKKAYKPEIQAALRESLPVGTCLALCSEYYGELIIVSTGVAGNLILQHGFYPTAYIRPETSTAVLNTIEGDSPDGEFAKVQKLIKQTCKTIIEFDNVEEFIDYVDKNQDFGK